MIYELPETRYALVAPLLEHVWIDRALLDGVIEGRRKARVFVERLEQPRTAFVACQSGDYVLLGAPEGPIRKFPRAELEEIARESFGYCAIVGREIASVAHAFRVSSRYASLSIDTTLPLRGRGLATVTCAALVAECLVRQLMPLWNCLESKEASARTALKLGMEEGPAQCESQWRSGWREIQTSSGVWARAHASGAEQVWRRLE